MQTSDFKSLIARVADGEALSVDQSAQAFDVMMSGEATPSQIGGFLMALRVRGETVDEISGAVTTMRSKMLRVDAPTESMDIVGTGGDGAGTYNISTCTAFVVAGAGVPVAKHGNRALSSKSGAADVLMALGVNIELNPKQISTCISDAGLGFMFAPAHHAAMKHVGPSRVELGTRTIFNILGPLSNPASTKRQLIGVFARQWVEPVAQAMKNLGATSVWVVHGSDGLDEITTTGSTHIAALENGEIRTFDLSPSDVGLAIANADDLKGGEAAENAEAIRRVLGGEKNPFRDIVLMNAGASLVVAGKVDDIKAGVDLAAQTIDGGEALRRLDKLVEISSAFAEPEE